MARGIFVICGVESVSQNFEHRFVALFLGEEFGDVFAVFVLIDNDMLRGRDEAVLDAAIATEALLVGSSVEESDVKGVVLLELG